MERSRGHDTRKKKNPCDNAHETRDMSIREYLEVKDKPKPKKTVMELIEECSRIGNAYDSDMKNVSDDGTVSETKKFLTMAEREAIFEKKCMILEKFRKEYHESFQKYKASLSKLRNEKEEYGSSQYRKGYEAGRNCGLHDAKSSLVPELEALSKRNKRLDTIQLCLIGTIIALVGYIVIF